MRGRDTFFAAPTKSDLARDAKVRSIVASHLTDWQTAGYVPDMPIEAGEETSRLFRERGWTHWHHLFSPRHLLIFSLIRRHAQRDARLFIPLCNALDFGSKLTMWINSGREGGGLEFTGHVFSNQALNTFYNYGEGSFFRLSDLLKKANKNFHISGAIEFRVQDARTIGVNNDIYITDPPYADAVNYHEITEYFIAWLRRSPPAPFDGWKWDSGARLQLRAMASRSGGA